MKYLLRTLSLLLVFPGHGLAVSFDSKLHFSRIDGFGEIRVRVDKLGEPVSSPNRLSIEVSCGKSLKYQMLIDSELTCEYEAASLSKDKRSLLVKQLIMNPKTGKCDLKYSKSYSLKDVCKK